MNGKKELWDLAICAEGIFQTNEKYGKFFAFGYLDRNSTEKL